MNQVDYKLCPIVVFVCFSVLPSFSQVIWSESFEEYVLGSGYLGSDTGAYYGGDFPHSISKWDLLIDSASFFSTNTHLKTVQINSSTYLESRRVGEEVTFITQAIPISGYTDVWVDIIISEVGAHDGSDFIKAFYQIDTASEQLFTYNGSIYDDFTSSKMSAYGLNGDSLRVVVKMLNNANDEKLRIDSVNVYGVEGTGSIMISELFYKDDDSGLSFLELRNVSNQSLDFSQHIYYVSIKNGVSWLNYQLSGSIASGAIITISKDSTTFINEYGFPPDLVVDSLFNDGLDSVLLYSGHIHESGEIVDVYGQAHQTDLIENWNYSNNRVLRDESLTSGSVMYDSLQWSNEMADVVNASPGAKEDELRYSSGYWRPNNIPPSEQSFQNSVCIAQGELLVNYNIACKELNILNNASLYLSPGKAITVTDTAVCHGKLTLLSDTLLSSFIVGDTLKGNLCYSFNLSDSWHLIAVPVINQNISEFILSPTNSIALSSSTNNYAVSSYNSINQYWQYIHNGSGFMPNISIAASENFESGIGYAMMRSSSGLVSFNGKNNNGDITKDLVASEWNLIGNPYPSFVSINSNTHTEENLLDKSGVSIDNLYEGVYIWDFESNTYRIINQLSPPSYLSPGQSFFIKASAENLNFSITRNMQSHSSGNSLQKHSSEHTSIFVQAQTTHHQSSTSILFNPMGSDGLDIGYDAAICPIGGSDFFVGTHLADGSYDSIDFSIQCLGDFTEATTLSIPLNVWSSSLQSVEFIIRYDNVSPNRSLFFVDDLMGTKVQLTPERQVLSVWVDSSTHNTNRFFIEIDSVQEPIYDSDPPTTTLYYNRYKNTLQIHNSVDEDCIIYVYDMLGRLVNVSQIKNNHNEVILPQLDGTLYVVYLVDKKGVLTYQIIKE